MGGLTAPHVELRAVTKRYGATTALAEVDLEVERGTIHALVGENGAGKSTLGKVVAGVVVPDGGRLAVAGEAVRFRSPRDALQHGITAVAQELALVPSATAVENVFLGVEDHAGPFVRRSAMRRRFDELVERTGIEVAGDVPVGALAVSDQQKVEILRALARRAELVVLDEPTARLSAAEATALMAVVRRLAAAGVTVLLVSHHLHEVLARADVVTVMRDGHVVRTRPCASEDHDSLVEGMIGRRLAASTAARRPAAEGAGTVLRVEGLTRRPAFEDVTFSVAAGEIVVLAGLVGAGRTEVVRAVFGADRVQGGSVVIDGQDVTARSVAGRVRSGVAMIPESRKDQGLLLLRPVRENMTLPWLRDFGRAGFVRADRERPAVREQAVRVGVRGAGTEAPVRRLSGGNQQKVLFARWLLRPPRLLIADEPTRGVDIGSKQAIYELLRELAGEGMAVLLVSSELDEVVALAHRVLVMRAGRIVAELTGDEVQEDAVVQAAFGVGAVP